MNDKNSLIHDWILDAFRLPEDSSIDISEKRILNDDISSTLTYIAIQINHSISQRYSISKPISDITYDDIIELKNSIKIHAIKEHPLLARLLRLFGWWFIFAGALTMFSVCPICGQVGCPIGVGTMGILAGFFAFLKHGGRKYIKLIQNRVFKNKPKSNA